MYAIRSYYVCEVVGFVDIVCGNAVTLGNFVERITLPYNMYVQI